MATSIDLTWVQPTGDMVESYIISYTFSINGCPGEDGTRMIPLSDGTTRQYTISGVEEDARYTISITAMNGAGSNNPATIMTTTPIAGRYHNINHNNFNIPTSPPSPIQLLFLLLMVLLSPPPPPPLSPSCGELYLVQEGMSK